MVSVIVSLSHAEVAKSAEFYFPSVFHAGAGVVVNFVTTRVRREFCPPPPPSGTPPVQGESQLQPKKIPRQPTVPLRQGAKRVFRRMTRCHSVPSEGRTPSVRRWAG